MFSINFVFYAFYTLLYYILVQDLSHLDNALAVHARVAIALHPDATSFLVNLLDGVTIPETIDAAKVQKKL